MYQKQSERHKSARIKPKMVSKLNEQFLRSATENDFKTYASRTRSQVESGLAELVSGLSELTLYPQIRYAVLSEGKRLRPLLVILSAETVGGSRDKVMSLALAFELMHTASLVHDDIIDQDGMRRGKPALYEKWSVNAALLTGDALIALAVSLASGYGEIVMKTLAESALALCDGENMDITSSLGTTTEESYFKRIKQKSASLFGAATYCGAWAGGGTPSEVRSLSMFGEKLGIAYQLRDDLLDLTSSAEPTPKDLKTLRLTLPLIHLYETSDYKEREQLQKNLQFLLGKEQSSSDIAVKNIQSMLAETGSMAYCKSRIVEYVQESIESIMSLRDNDSRSYLIQMAESLII